MTESYGQAGTVTNAPTEDVYKSNIRSMEVNRSVITGVGNDQIGSNWDWDDDDRGIVMDIQSLLSEFGDFGDFFENDVLPFGEVISYPSIYSITKAFYLIFVPFDLNHLECVWMRDLEEEFQDGILASQFFAVFNIILLPL